jgi:hypothetical protein
MHYFTGLLLRVGSTRYTASAELPPTLIRSFGASQSSRIVFPRESRDTEASSVVRHDGDPMTRPVLKRYFIEKERVKGESDNPNNGGRSHHSEP